MWEQLKEKLPMKAEYHEDEDNFEVTIEDMEITEELVTFHLKELGGEPFNVSCSRDYLGVGIAPDERGLLIKAYCWTMLLPKRGVVS